MNKFFRTNLLIGLILGQVIGYLFAGAATYAVSVPPTVLISELQTNGGPGHAGNEFIELYNPTDTDIALDGWAIQYHSTSNSDCLNGWSKTPKINLITPAAIASHGFYLMAANGYLDHADSRFTAGLSDTAGAIRLLRNDMSEADALAWGAAQCGHGNAAASPTLGRSLERRPGADKPTGGNAIDTTDNAHDFVLTAVPGPQDSSAAPEYPETAISTSEPTTIYLPLTVTELLIDPVSPASDAHDEFIELYNPNDEAMNVGGYTLKTPNSQYHLEPAVVPAHAYRIITSADSTLSLSNEGGNLQILDPNGVSVDQSAPWPKAVPGAAWMYSPEGWSWTSTPTPGSDNKYTDLPQFDIPSDNVHTPPASDNAAYLPLTITELLPDPVSPQADAKDEFVELYNPNNEPVDTAGYIIKSGANLGNSSALRHHIIAPHSYLALFSAETGLPLSNTGGAVQLFDPAGLPIGQSISYDQAKPGLSWALDPVGIWQWSTTPTPDLGNVITAPVITPKSAPSSIAKLPATKPKANPKIKAIKPAKQVAAKKAKASKSPPTTGVKPAAFHQTSGHTLLLVLFGLTICYVIYEFRYDIRHTYHRFRGNTKSRP